MPHLPRFERYRRRMTRRERAATDLLYAPVTQSIQCSYCPWKAYSQPDESPAEALTRLTNAYGTHHNATHPNEQTVAAQFVAGHK